MGCQMGGDIWGIRRGVTDRGVRWGVTGGSVR